MSKTLTQIISEVQGVLNDSGANFTTTLCTSAIRSALRLYNRVAPQHLGTLIDGVSDQYEYELTDADARALHVVDVLLQDDDNGEQDVRLTYDEYIEDERVFFRLRQPVDDSETLVVRYTAPQTISGLDSETETTILDTDIEVIVDGAAWKAIMSRAVSLVETINLSPEQSRNYKEIASHFQAAFNAGLATVGRRRNPGVGEPDARAWNDEYHSWEQ